MKALVGFEFEMSSPLSFSQVEKELKKRKILNAIEEVVPDISIEKAAVNHVKCEIVTKPLPKDKALNTFRNISEFMDEVGMVTNKSTGLHINVSIDTNMKRVNPEMVIASTDDLYIAEIYKRKNNSYCVPWKYIVKKLNFEVKKFNARKRFYKDISLKDEFSALISNVWFDGWTEEFFPHSTIMLNDVNYTSINISKLELGYIEYRMVGGKNYHKNDVAVEDAIDHFILGQSISTKTDNRRIENYLEWAIS